MAAIKTIKTRAGTRYQIQFYLCRERKYLSLDSGFTLKQARRFKGYIEDAVDAIESGGTPSRAVISFLEDLPRSLRQKFANAGLLEQSREVTTQELWQLFLDADSDRKMSTRQTYLTAQKRFFAFFKPDGDPSLITSADCKRWKKFLKSHGYADATLAGSHSRASAVFRWGVRHDYVDKNPFEDVKRESFVNEHRMHFVPMGHYERLLDACPDQTWRTLLALCRIGGLRNPSETLELRWTDVDWKNRSILVRSPKTEHHAGKESRLIPMFPRLREELEAQWDLASSGDSPLSSTDGAGQQRACGRTSAGSSSGRVLNRGIGRSRICTRAGRTNCGASIPNTWRANGWGIPNGLRSTTISKFRTPSSRGHWARPPPLRRRRQRRHRRHFSGF